MQDGIRYVDIDHELRDRINREWKQVLADHIVLENGFSLGAMQGDLVVGLIGVEWRQLPDPLPTTLDAYINVIEVHDYYRQQGIARHLLKLAEERAQAAGAYQLRAWSSADKLEAIPMWKSLGYALCPAVTYPRGLTIHGYYVAKVLR